MLLLFSTNALNDEINYDITLGNSDTLDANAKIVIKD